jgi:hypothetical protein
MAFNLPTPPAQPDLGSPSTFNARALGWFSYLGGSFKTYLEGLSAADFFNTQTSVQDATPGRVVLTGGFGWGQAGNTQTNLASLNATITSGVHQFGASTANAPFTTGGSLLVIRYANNWVHQIGFSPNDATVWIRRTQNNGADWSIWVPLVPQRGSNANGQFVRFADGTQICTNDNAAIVTNPAVFVGTVTNIDGNKLRLGRWY